MPPFLYLIPHKPERGRLDDFTGNVKPVTRGSRVVDQGRVEARRVGRVSTNWPVVSILAGWRRTDVGRTGPLARLLLARGALAAGLLLGRAFAFAGLGRFLLGLLLAAAGLAAGLTATALLVGLGGQFILGFLAGGR
ncbi:hypothetical protein HZA87_05815, partial [Candidatus Uhrbacteria bacterium]|nr:hypothetical protein [Candidatus Uhrbacteria bacterium]